MANSDLVLLLHHLESQDYIPSFILHLLLELEFSAVTQNEQSCTGETCYHQDQGG